MEHIFVDTNIVIDLLSKREEFYKDVRVPGSSDELNPELEKALRVADFIDLGQLMAMDALQRNESCGGHFREGIRCLRDLPKQELGVSTCTHQAVGAHQHPAVERPNDICELELLLCLLLCRETSPDGIDLIEGKSHVLTARQHLVTLLLCGGWWLRRCWL